MEIESIFRACYRSLRALLLPCAAIAATATWAAALDVPSHSAASPGSARPVRVADTATDCVTRTANTPEYLFPLQAAIARCASTSKSGFTSCRGAQRSADAKGRRYSLPFEFPDQVESFLAIQGDPGASATEQSGQSEQAQVIVYFGRHLPQEKAIHVFLDKAAQLAALCPDVGIHKQIHKDDSRPWFMSLSIYNFSPDMSVEIVHRPLNGGQEFFDVYMTLSPRRWWLEPR